MKRWIACGLLLWASAPSLGADAQVELRSVNGEFEDIRERVVFAIEGQGLVLNYTAHISDMLDRTGKDVGSARRIYRQAQVLEFCSAGASRRAMEASPHNIAYCPYAIAVYTLPEEPGKVYVTYRKPPASAALQPVSELLATIVREALQ